MDDSNKKQRVESENKVVGVTTTEDMKEDRKVRFDVESNVLSETIRIPLKTSLTVAEASTEILRQICQKLEVTLDKAKISSLRFFCTASGKRNELCEGYTLHDSLDVDEKSLYAEVLMESSSSTSSSSSSSSTSSETKTEPMQAEMEQEAIKEVVISPSSPPRGETQTLITVRFRTVQNAMKADLPAPGSVLINQQSTLVDLKHAIARELGVNFTPDMGESGSRKKNRNESTTTNLTLLLAKSNKLTVTLNLTDDLDVLKQKIATQTQSNVQDIHYLIVNGTRFFSTFTQRVTVSDIVKEQLAGRTSTGPSPVEVYGNADVLLSIQNLESWDVNVVGIGTEMKGFVDRGTGVVEIDNWSMTHRRAQTVADLKRVFIAQYLPGTLFAMYHYRIF